MIDSTSADAGAEIVTVSAAGSSTSIPIANTPLRLTHAAGASVQTVTLGSRPDDLSRAVPGAGHRVFRPRRHGLNARPRSGRRAPPLVGAAARLAANEPFELVEQAPQPASLRS